MSRFIPEVSHDALKEILGLHQQKLLSQDSEAFARIVAFFLSEKQAVQHGEPYFINILGGPGSGKSYFFEMKIKSGDLPDNAVIHDPDCVMQMIPDYLTECQSNPEQAFQQWEKPARQLSHEILYQAIQSRYSIIYQRTLATPEAIHLLHFVKKMGYYIKTYAITCDIKTAISRNSQRMQATMRHLPEQEVVKRHRLFLKKLPEVIQISDEYYLYNNNANGALPTCLSTDST